MYRISFQNGCFYIIITCLHTLMNEIMHNCFYLIVSRIRQEKQENDSKRLTSIFKVYELLEIDKRCNVAYHFFQKL